MILNVNQIKKFKKKGYILIKQLLNNNELEKYSSILSSKYISNNNDFYSSGFFNSSLDKFTYYNTRKGFLDTDNYFKDPWDQRSLDDYIRYIHMPPVINHSEINTIYDRNK